VGVKATGECLGGWDVRGARDVIGIYLSRGIDKGGGLWYCIDVRGNGKINGKRERHGKQTSS
jgi:hypothetical protein